MATVSIVLPVYNGEKFLSKALDSIINQTYVDWELIVVNDCSQDGTLAIIKEYMQKDNRVFLVNNEENMKLPQSLNIGFRWAKGMYLTWTSDDNIFMADALEKMVTYLDTHSEKMVCAGMYTIDEDGNRISEWDKYSNDKMYYQNVVGACFMYCKEVVDQIGEYDTTMFLVEDYEYWLRILDEYGEIGYLEENIYLYRIHEGSLTAKREKEIQTQLKRLRKKYIASIIKYFSKNGMYHNLVRIYIDFMIDGTGEFSSAIAEMNNKFPFLKNLKVLEDEQELIAYGAGNVGDIAFKIFGQRIDLYMDKNANSIICKNGKKVVPPSKIEKYIRKTFLITMADEKVYDALIFLVQHGVENICVYSWRSCLV